MVRAMTSQACAWLSCVLMLVCTTPTLAHRASVAQTGPNYDLHLTLTDQERAYLASLPTLRIGVDPDWPPYTFVNAQDEPDGISSNYLNYVVQSLHIKVRRVPSTSWRDTVHLATSGQVDLLIAMSQDSQFTASFLPTHSYIDFPEVIVTRKLGKRLGDIRSLSHLNVAMVDDGGTGSAPGLDTAISFHQLTVANVREGLQAVSEGRADAFVGNYGVVERLIREHYAGELHVSGATGYSQSLSFGVASNYEPLRVLIDRVLAAIPEEDRERIQNTWLSTSLTYGVPQRTLWEVLTPIGVAVLVSIVILGFIIAYLRKEVRQRLKAEQELRFQIQFLQSLMATAPIPVFVKDLEGRYITVNAAFEQLVGVPADKLVGKTASDVHPLRAASNDRLEALTKEALSTGKLVRGELQYRSRAGETHDVMYWLQLVHEESGRPRALLGILVDVSALRAMERGQRLQAEHLARAKQEVEQASRVKDVFLATMSHEIRTPMSGVIGVLDLMNRARLHEDDQRLLDMARSAARTLLRILNDVLDFSKSQSGKLTIDSQPFSLQTVIDEVVGLFTPAMQRKGLRFDVFVSALVAPGYIGDGQRLAQVLLNLVGNALKFTDEGGIGVAVEARPINAASQTQSVSITVRDTGIGIDDAEQARLFEPFVQVGTRHQGGTGLGLAICKRLVQAMGGSIGLRSAVGKGTSVEITLELPVDADASPMHADLPEQRKDTQIKAVAILDETVTPLSIPEHAILLVEDQPINRELLARQFQALGVHAFDTAVNGLDAWHAFEEHAYALVVTDCAMPEMDGEALIRRIRTSESGTGRHAYLVALTANAMESQRQACLNAGADDVLVKPLNLDDLRAMLARAFDNIASIPSSPSSLPDGISAAEWPELRKRILDDMKNELATARQAAAVQNWKHTWEAVHRILGMAKWFKLSAIAASAQEIQTALDEQRTHDVRLQVLGEAIAALAVEGKAQPVQSPLS
jgi:two-component system sensor histidine kinase EvgS